MHLNEELKLEQARVKKVAVEFGPEDPKITLTIRTALTKDVCDSFGCFNLIYAGTVPRSGVKKMVLDGSQIDTEFHLRHDNLAFYAVANEIGHYVADFEGEGTWLEFRLKLTGYAELVVDLATKIKVDPVEIVLKPAQMNLDGMDKPAQSTAPAEESACIECNNQIPLQEGNPALHASGQPCRAYKPQEADEGATLASAAIMGTGTHQKGKRGQKKRGQEEVEDDFMEAGAPVN